jgi:hypothetical protein
MEKSAKIDAATNNIPTDFSTAAGSLAIQDAVSGRKGIAIYNGSSSRLAVCVSHHSATVAPADNVNATLYVPATTGIAIDNVYCGKTVYIRSDESLITSGVVTVSLWDV